LKNKIFALLLLMLSACSPVSSLTTQPTAPAAAVSTSTAAAETFSDPFAYCAAVGQIDAPDGRYTGPIMSDALFSSYLKAAGLDAGADYPDAFKKMTIWRCMDNKVYACNFGANIPCDSKADTSKTPTQAMLDYCKENPGVDFIPMYVTGHTVIYTWRCVKDTPEVLNQVDSVDAAGYQSNNWQALEPGK
jgi:hypothetical protein